MAMRCLPPAMCTHGSGLLPGRASGGCCRGQLGRDPRGADDHLDDPPRAQLQHPPKHHAGRHGGRRTGLVAGRRADRLHALLARPGHHEVTGSELHLLATPHRSRHDGVRLRRPDPARLAVRSDAHRCGSGHRRGAVHPPVRPVAPSADRGDGQRGIPRGRAQRHDLLRRGRRQHLRPQGGPPTGTVEPLASSTTHYYERPRVSPDGSLFYIDIDLAVVDDPTDNTFTVMSPRMARAARRPPPSGRLDPVNRPDSTATTSASRSRRAPRTSWATPTTTCWRRMPLVSCGPTRARRTGLGRLAGRMGGGWNIYSGLPGRRRPQRRQPGRHHRPGCRPARLWLLRTDSGMARSPPAGQVGSGWSPTTCWSRRATSTATAWPTSSATDGAGELWTLQGHVAAGRFGVAPPASAPAGTA